MRLSVAVLNFLIKSLPFCLVAVGRGDIIRAGAFEASDPGMPKKRIGNRGYFKLHIPLLIAAEVNMMYPTPYYVIQACDINLFSESISAFLLLR